MEIPFKQAKRIQIWLLGITFTILLKFRKLAKNGYGKTFKFGILVRPN